MDCLDALQLLSAATDGEPVDPALLESARAHCASCDECSHFVRAQLLAAKVGPPAPPSDLADRVMAAVRAEAAAQERAARESAAAESAAVTAAATASGAAAAADVAAGVAPTLADTAAPATAGRPPGPPAQLSAARRKSRISARDALIGFAAVALVGAIAIALAGSRYILSAPTMNTAANSPATSGQPGTVPEAAPTAKSGADAQSGGAQLAAPVSASPGFITVTGTVYRADGPATIDATTLHDAGLVTTSLSATEAPTPHTVRAGTDPDLLYVSDSSGALLGFTRVKRQFNGRTYYLTSAALTSLDAWPALPASVAPPTSPDGYPTFVQVGSDSSGVKVYRLSSSPGSGDIAIAPGSPASDPAVGNPNWTLWEPAP